MLARESGLDPTTVNRMEQADLEPARGTMRSVQAVVDALARCGVEVGEDSIRLLPRPKPKPRR